MRDPDRRNSREHETSQPITPSAAMVWSNMTSFATDFETWRSCPHTLRSNVYGQQTITDEQFVGSGSVDWIETRRPRSGKDTIKDFTAVKAFGPRGKLVQRVSEERPLF